MPKPADDPGFFWRPPPEGRSRESSIRLDAHGRFWHDGRLVEHQGLSAGLHTWISRHPDGRYILTNGYDWTYFTVDDAPYVVRTLRVEPSRIVLVLSDGTEEDWDASTARVGPDGAVYATVKSGARGGPYEAKFSRGAQTALAPVLVDGDPPAVTVGGRVETIGSNRARLG